MKKEQLLFSKQHAWADGNVTKEFTAKVYKGGTFRKAKLDTLSEVVEVKAFRLEVREIWTWDGEEFYTDFEDFGYITSRSGEFAHALRLMQGCANLDEFRKAIAGLVEDFSAALDRDAKRELKRLLYGANKTNPVVRTNKVHQPLPQIRLPWEKE